MLVWGVWICLFCLFFFFWQHIQGASGKKRFQLRNYLHQIGLKHSFMASASVPAFKFLRFVPVLAPLKDELTMRNVSQIHSFLPILLLVMVFVTAMET